MDFSLDARSGSHSTFRRDPEDHRQALKSIGDVPSTSERSGASSAVTSRRPRFASSLHLQLAAELGARLPRVLADHRLKQVRGFKYDPDIATGINIHADFARINLNFWITRDDANVDPGAGALLVYDIPAPTSWTFKEYNHHAAASPAFLPPLEDSPTWAIMTPSHAVSRT